MDHTTSQPTLRRFLEELHRSRLTWVVAPWDTAADEFLSCLNNLQSSFNNVYRLDASSYRSLAEFNETLDGRAGCTSLDLCNLLKHQTNPVLLIDNIPSVISTNGQAVLEELVSVARIFVDFCPELQVVLRSKNIIKNASLNPIILRKMDEADCNKYVLSHPDGQHINDADLATSWIFESSGGLPKAVDRLLEKLRYMSIEDLANAGSDLAINAVNTKFIPGELAQLIDGLLSRTDDDGRRTIALLKCLTILPFGEEFTNFRRFFQDTPFYPQHVTALLDEGLVDTMDFLTLQSSDNKPKVTVAKSVAQDYIRSKLSKDEFSHLTFLAVSFYYGREWTLGKFKLNNCLRLDKHSSSSYAIQNANSLSKRLVIDALDSEDKRSRQDALRLLAFYTHKLDSSHQYRLLADLCHSLIPNLKAVNEKFAEDILVRYGISLRMLKEPQNAIGIFQYILAQTPTAEINAKIQLEIAFCYQALKVEVPCISAARAAKDYKPGSAISLQAESIIASFLPVSKKISKLRKLKKACEDNGYFLAANNIEILIITETECPEKELDGYKRLAKKASNEKDTYNTVRAVIHYTNCAISIGENLSDQDLSNLIVSYHFVASQRMMRLFNLSNETLWTEFERLSQPLALFSLYKQSSLLYRLNADIKNEKKFLARLINNQTYLTALAHSLSDADAEYLKKRIEELGVGMLSADLKRTNEGLLN